MEAKDLMIGDLVRVNRDVCIKNDTIVRVCGIDATNRLVEKGLEGSATYVPVDDIDFYSGSIWVKYLSPIPLTPEILEKNGFKRIEGNRFYPNPRWVFAQDGSRDGVVIEIVLYEQPINGVNILTKINTQSSKDYGVNDIHNCDIEYVHQLQHALRLCGIDKEIIVC